MHMQCNDVISFRNLIAATCKQQITNFRFLYDALFIGERA